MDNLNHIESYFSKQLAPEQIREFEIRIEQDPAFAEEVAFYLSAQHISKEVSRTEKKQHYKELYQMNPVSAFETETKTKADIKSYRSPVMKLVFAISAAAVAAAVVFGIYTWINPVSPKQLADRYIQDNLQTLGVTMSSNPDSLQNGLRLYNDGKTEEALAMFEKIAAVDDSALDAKKYAGLSALRLKEYDKALGYFKQMERFRSLYSNPSLFLQALTLMERNQSGDPVRAKGLLQKVIDSNQEGKEVATEWLRKL